MNRSTRIASVAARMHGRYQRFAARYMVRRLITINTDVPIISFTFDDFPRSALLVGGAILKHSGVTGTYYASFGLSGTKAPSGAVFLQEDIHHLLEAGHELGCHTFSHCHSWDTESLVFEESIFKNEAALSEIAPMARLKTFAYPICPPRPTTKRVTARHFVCCRGGGQTLNCGKVDLNHLAGYFLEKDEDNAKRCKDLIDQNKRVRGWLIFATHDVSSEHTPFGCTPRFFESVVHYAVESGARILPVIRACELLHQSPMGS
jgi:peptidoglycan/xylan/chitin deacetylase (PgdA/CDA1 family)